MRAIDGFLIAFGTAGGDRNDTVKYYSMLLWTLAEAVGAVGGGELAETN